MQVQTPEPKLGFTRFTEVWNGRLTMISFLAVMLLEIATRKGILG